MTVALLTLAVLDAACCLTLCRDQRRLRRLERQVDAATNVGAVLARNAPANAARVPGLPERHLRVVP